MNFIRQPVPIEIIFIFKFGRVRIKRQTTLLKGKGIKGSIAEAID